MTKEELEKEADEYVTTTGNNDCTIEAYIAGAESREKRIAELEKDNKALKALRKYEGNVASAEIEKLQEKNAKAKEIIEGLLELGSIGDGDYIYVEEAEDFIKE